MNVYACAHFAYRWQLYAVIVIPVMHVINDFSDKIKEVGCRVVAPSIVFPIGSVEVFYEINAALVETGKDGVK